VPTRSDRAERDDLLAAYVDGVGELTPDERRGIEARLPELRADAAATRDLLAALRDLPAEGAEPVWADLAKRISDEVGPVAPRAWWRRWLWPATTTLALATCAALAIYAGSTRTAEPIATLPPAPAPVALTPHPAPAPAANAVWLDGEAVDLDDTDSGSLDALRELDELGDLDPPDATADITGGALLPTPDLAWVDDLDPVSLARAERWLVGRKGT